MPAANATAAASARVRTPSFSKMLPRWNFTVCLAEEQLLRDLAIAPAQRDLAEDVELSIPEDADPARSLTRRPAPRRSTRRRRLRLDARAPPGTDSTSSDPAKRLGPAAEGAEASVDDVPRIEAGAVVDDGHE